MPLAIYIHILSSCSTVHCRAACLLDIDMPGVDALLCVCTAYAPMAVQPTLLPDYSSNSMDRVISVEGTPTLPLKTIC